MVTTVAYQRSYRLLKKKERADYNRDYCKRHVKILSHKKFIRKLRGRYGLSYEEWLQMRERQEDRCMICCRKFDHKLVPCVDHDHKTGRVRSLLCSPCNSGIGGLQDSPELLARAIVYLECC